MHGHRVNNHTCVRRSKSDFSQIIIYRVLLVGVHAADVYPPTVEYTQNPESDKVFVPVCICGQAVNMRQYRTFGEDNAIHITLTSVGKIRSNREEFLRKAETSPSMEVV